MSAGSGAAVCSPQTSAWGVVVEAGLRMVYTFLIYAMLVLLRLPVLAAGVASLLLDYCRLVAVLLFIAPSWTASDSGIGRDWFQFWGSMSFMAFTAACESIGNHVGQALEV